jgi:hypothetical protein
MKFSRVSIALIALPALTLFSTTAAAEQATLFRVFLNDGTAVVSYGEYARVGDRVIFSMPIGAVGGSSTAGASLHVVNLPATAVNWTESTRYADSARFAHYLATSAEADYMEVAVEIAAALNDVLVIKDPRARLKHALDARARLAQWPSEHYGYRADDVREMLGLLDEAISGMRAAAGETRFALELVAGAAPPERVPLARDPTPAESITQAIAVAKATDVAADRMSILRTILGMLEQQRRLFSKTWVEATRKWTARALGEEIRADREYAALVASSAKRAEEAAAQADVRRVEQVVEDISRQDRKLGGRRPEEISALIAQVQSRLDAARQLRLARDQWTERVGGYRVYTRAIASIVETLKGAQAPLDDIKRLAGSDARTLVRLGDRLSTGMKTLHAMNVPDELKAAHALLSSAVNLADTAVKTRRQAVISGELSAAWDASSAAAGSMMLFARAQEDMEATVKLPHIR